MRPIELRSEHLTPPDPVERRVFPVQAKRLDKAIEAWNEIQAAKEAEIAARSPDARECVMCNKFYDEDFAAFGNRIVCYSCCWDRDPEMARKLNIPRPQLVAA